MSRTRLTRRNIQKEKENKSKREKENKRKTEKQD